MQLVKRDRYLEEALRFRDSDLIKVVTGVRRCGKSSLLELIEDWLLAEGVPSQNIAKLNLESLSENIDTYKDMYAYFEKRVASQGKTYIFIDEVQNIFEWEKAVNALRIDFNCDIYITGSNAYLLSSELSTYLSGRYVEIKMLPLTFSEYLDFCGLKQSGQASQEGLLFDEDNGVHLLDTIFSTYRKYGGMPRVAAASLDQAKHSAYMNTLYESVVTRDVLDRERDKSRRTITNPELLRRICFFLADNIGNPFSTPSVRDSLKSLGYSTSADTIEVYTQALADAYIFYPAKRFDIRGKDHLKTLGKFYIVDVGLRNYLMNYRDLDQGRTLENIVFLQLLFEGYSVSVGKLYQKEIDFVATKDERKIFIQVADSMHDAKTLRRELDPLISLKNGYEKIIIAGEGRYPHDLDGVRIINASKFLIEGTG